MTETLEPEVVFSFDNPKQCEFYDTVMGAVAGDNPYRYFFYGGAIRGGKTYVCLFILWQLAELFPNSRWHIFREDNPALESTVIPSMQKMIGSKGKNFIWKNAAGNTHIQFDNGSKIFFKSENIQGDPDLKDLLGLETNGIFMEQMESLSERLFQRSIERIGSWYINPMPPPLLLGSFNPTQTWVKKTLFDKFERGELDAPYFYMRALHTDNPHVTQEQRNSWINLDPNSKLTMIQGIWKFEATGNLFAYSFDATKHTYQSSTDWHSEIDRRLPVYLSFDFNVDPITCLVCQRDGTLWGKVIMEYRLRNSDIFELTERITNDLGEYYLICTGDASGRQRNAGVKGRSSYVDTIRTQLRLSPKQIQFPMSNPSIANTRVVLNSILNKHPNFKISSRCLFLIDDLETVKTDDKGGIEKDKDSTKTHLLDDLRYFVWNYFRTFVNLTP